MVRRETVRRGVLAEVSQPDRSWVGDQQAENAPPVRQVTDAESLIGGDPARDELHQEVLGADDSEWAVPPPVRAVAASTIRVRTPRRSRSEEIAITASSRAR